MRILIQGINFAPEAIGVGKYTTEMAKWLAGRGHEVRVVTAPPHNPEWRVPSEFSAWKYSREYHSSSNSVYKPYPQNHSRAGIEVFRCPLWVPRNPNGLRRLLHLASFGLSSWPTMLRQRGWHPNLVLSIEPTLFCSLQALFLAHWSGAKSWLHVQDLEVDAAFELGDIPSPKLRNWALALERKLLRRFNRVSVISDRMAEIVLSKGVEPSHCVFFPNWVDTEMIQPLSGPSPLRQMLGISEDRIVALYSGSMGKKQGLNLLADAAREHSHRSDLLYVFCGEGSYRHILVESTKNLPNVLHLPLQPFEQLNDLLNLADIQLLPQRSDAADLVMPSKLTGMLASGRPVVTTAKSGTQLAKTVQGRGVVVEPGDLSAFTSAIVSLVTDKDLRLKLGHHAREYALAHLDLNGILLRFEESIIAACNGVEARPSVDRLHMALSAGGSSGVQPPNGDEPFVG